LLRQRSLFSVSVIVIALRLRAQPSWSKYEKFKNNIYQFLILYII